MVADRAGAWLLILAWLNCGLAEEKECDSHSPSEAQCDSHGVLSADFLQLRTETQPLKSSPWPHARGPVSEVPHSGWTPESFMNHSLRWTYKDPLGQYMNMFAAGAVIDVDENLFQMTYKGIFAFNKNGKQIWHYETPGVSNNEPLLVDDLVLGSTQQGNAFAVERLTGHVRWIAALADDAGGDAGYPNAHEGIFVVSAHKSWKAPTDGGNERIFGLHVSNGSRIWQYTPEVPVWNFAPLFPADGSVVFMDWTGGVYRLNLTTGEEIWKVLAESNKSFGDGGVALSETMVYSCSNFGHFTGDEGTPGVVRAFYLSNGTEVWSKFLEMPCNSYPAVGHLAGFDQLALVVTPGSFMDLFHHVGRALRGEVLALDALTGAQLWRYPVAPYDGGPIGMAVGDFEGFPARVLEGIQLVCYPAHWSAPLIDGSGQVLVSRADGNLHWILGPEVEFPNLKRTANMTVRNGLLSEVRHLGSGFIHGAISAGPGLFAISTCDTLFVFQK